MRCIQKASPVWALLGKKQLLVPQEEGEPSDLSTGRMPGARD